MAEKMTLCAPCLFGLESVLAGEARRIGGENVVATDGKVTFTGDEAVLARANLCLRTAERVLIVLGAFSACSFVELFDRTAVLPFEQYIGRRDCFPVKGWSLKSQLRSVPDCQSIIKKAAVRRLESAYKQTWFEESGPVHQIRFSIHKDTVSIMLDTSGEGLHKRGYRLRSMLAPIKETLAAGIADLAHVRADSFVIDPMCGSGTLLIEAALHAFRIPAGARRHFAAERWDVFHADVWQSEREQALGAVRRGAAFEARGYDLDHAAVALAEENAKRAGVGKKLTVAQRGIHEFLCEAEQAVILCNPPYGERLLEVKDAEKLYCEMGRRFPAREGLCYYIISPHERFEELFGRPAKRRRKLYNGMIKCWLYMYF